MVSEKIFPTKNSNRILEIGWIDHLINESAIK
jgi:hypothetical protein